MNGKAQDAEKERYWQKTIREATRSGGSIREYCRNHQVKESQFYWWQRKLEGRKRPSTGRRSDVKDKQGSFALVTHEPGSMDAGIEIVLCNGRRVRISKGVDEQTLRAVLAAVESEGC